MDDEDGLLGRELEARVEFDTLGEGQRKAMRAQVMTGGGRGE
jgi:hypothetical protein